MVVPHAGTWIEIIVNQATGKTKLVVPHAGTWIEMLKWVLGQAKLPSFPTRERGVKLVG